MAFWAMPLSISRLALLKIASSSPIQLFALLANQQKRISDDSQFVTCTTLALGLTWRGWNQVLVVNARW